MIRLGSFDSGVDRSKLRDYISGLETTTRVPVNQLKDGHDKIFFREHKRAGSVDMSVSEVQQALKDIGFFPGGAVDGIGGYRTLSAIRLFQEYVRTIEQLPSIPDGVFGPNAQRHLKRWMKESLKPDWSATVEAWDRGDTDLGEYSQWLHMLDEIKSRYFEDPTPLFRKIGVMSDTSDTRKVHEWDFDPRHMHLIGIRRNEHSGMFDDIFVFLIKGMVFKFQGSTEPGSSSNPKGTPFLVQGQHDYHFGWHRKQYLALRPRTLQQGKGVLVVRSKNNRTFEESDLENGLEPNYTINIHWGGKGRKFNVNKWSEGCQVINASFYLNHHNDLIDCSEFSARNNSVISSKKTRGAYNVLLDLATALSGDMDTRTIKYTLLVEKDLAVDPELQEGMKKARERAVKMLS